MHSIYYLHDASRRQCQLRTETLHITCSMNVIPASELGFLGQVHRTEVLKICSTGKVIQHTSAVLSVGDAACVFKRMGNIHCTDSVVCVPLARVPSILSIKRKLPNLLSHLSQ